MLTLRRKAVPLEVPVKEPIDLSPFEIPQAEYLKLAARVSYTPGILKKQRECDRLALLAECDLSVFSSTAVHSYLDNLFGKRKFISGWNRPFMAATWGWRYLRDVGYGQYSPHRNGEVLHGPYTKAIPYPVLLTIDQINRKADISSLHQRPEFVVSDVVVDADFHDPDPFLGCFWGSSEIIVIERWDEPSFRME